MGHHVRRATVLQVISEVFGARNQRRRIVRREYRVRAPLSVVHIDGNHKLAKKLDFTFFFYFIQIFVLQINYRWRFVVHGGIDGYSRLIFFMNVSSNNRARTVLEAFVSGVQEYGLPSRIRYK
jgi:hypothetical protein